MRLLVDTNVFLECLLKRERQSETEEFFKLALIRRQQTCVTAMSLRDIGYIVHKYNHDKGITKRMVQKVYEITSKVINTSADAAIESIYLDAKDYDDSMQMLAAEEAMCTAIITYDRKGFEGSNLPVFTPKEICDIWKKENRL